MTKIVLDTNVIVSAILSPKGACSKIMDLVFAGEMQACYSADILAEYKDVLFRSTLDLNSEKRKEFFEVIQKAGTLIEPAVSDMKLPDESDRTFYDTAKESGAILITGNVKHYPVEPFIMTPSEFFHSEMERK